jgi:photosynthetic reaction center cytochrome c subunit
MRTKITKRIWIGIALAAVAFLICVSRNTEETRAQAQNPQTPRTAAQVFKNIQILKEMPASQLQSTMSFMAASLGVDCSHCHTRPAMENDDKPAKLVARRMMVMMNGINKTLGDKTLVNCATCHRGQLRPAVVPPLPSLASPFISGTTAANAALPTLDEILAKYIKAVGGERALSKIKTRKRSGAVEVGGVRGSFELYEAAPDKQFLTGTLPPPLGSVTQAFDGSAGWVKNQNGVFDIRGDGLAQAKLEANFYAETRLKEQFKTMIVVEKLREGNREFYVIDATRPDGVTEKLFFDVQSGFLVRRSWEARTYFGALLNTTDFDNYKKIGSIWLPFTVRRIRGGTTFVQNVAQYKLNVAIGDAMFKKPAAPK